MRNCIFCKIIQNDFSTIKTTRDDIIYSNEWITIFLASDGWKHNFGHLLIIPNKHFDNLYDISDEYLAIISAYSKKCSLLLKNVYACDGVTIRQNNEQYGGQDVFHYHMHVFPRYKDDDFNLSPRIEVPQLIRKEYASLLKNYVSQHTDFFEK